VQKHLLTTVACLSIILVITSCGEVPVNSKVKAVGTSTQTIEQSGEIQSVSSTTPTPTLVPSCNLIPNITNVIRGTKTQIQFTLSQTNAESGTIDGTPLQNGVWQTTLTIDDAKTVNAVVKSSSGNEAACLVEITATEPPEPSCSVTASPQQIRSNHVTEVTFTITANNAIKASIYGKETDADNGWNIKRTFSHADSITVTVESASGKQATCPIQITEYQ
jgi:hypothetical protein